MITADKYLEKNPRQMLLDSLKLMLPKTKLSEKYLNPDRIKVYNDDKHDLTHLGLPQFMPLKNRNYHEMFGLNYKKTGIKIHKDPDNIIDMDELKKHTDKIEIIEDEQSDLRDWMRKKEYKVIDHKKEIVDNFVKKKRARQLRLINKMSYRYI